MRCNALHDQEYNTHSHLFEAIPSFPCSSNNNRNDDLTVIYSYKNSSPICNLSIVFLVQKPVFKQTWQYSLQQVLDIFVTNATQTGILPTNIDSSIAGAIFLIFIFYILDNDG